MTFTRNQPLATDDLSISQPYLFNNTNASDDSFGVDHYKFSNLTANNGFHNQMTTPLIVGGVHPVTAAAIPKMYGMQDSANIGVINYSRGPSNAVPTPITHLQSPATPLSMINPATLTILNFTGLARAFCTLYVMNTSAPVSYSQSLIVWTGSAFIITRISGTSGELIASSTGNTLIISNNNVTPTTDIYWTLQMDRLQ